MRDIFFSTAETIASTTFFRDTHLETIEHVMGFRPADNLFIRCFTAQAGFVWSVSLPKPPIAVSLETKEAFGVFAKDLFLDSLRHIAPLAPASDVVFFCRGVAVREVRGAHEAILSHMLQEIIKILVSFAVHERPSRTEELLRIAVVAAVNCIINGPSLPLRDKAARRVSPEPAL